MFIYKKNPSKDLSIVLLSLKIRSLFHIIREFSVSELKGGYSVCL